MAMTDENPPPRSDEGAAPPRSTAATAGLVLGVLGTTAIAFGLVLYLLEPRLLPLAVANGLFGAFGLVAYAVTNRPALGRAFRGRSAPLVALEVVMALGLLSLAVVANYAAAGLQKEWDLTRDRLFTLHPQSQQVAEGLTETITVYGFFASSDPRRGQLAELVRLYRQFTPLIETRLEDPDRASPQLLERFELDAKGPRIVVASSTRHVKIAETTEQALTNALVDLTERPIRTIGFVTGHRERSHTDAIEPRSIGSATRALHDDGYEVATVDLTNGAIESDLLIVASPARMLLDPEIEALDRYLDEGGRMLLLAEPGDEAGLDGLLEELGVVLGKNVIVDANPTAKSIGFNEDAPVVRAYEPHPITNPLRNQVTLFPRAQSVSPKLGQTSVTTMIRSSESSWAEADAKAAPPYELDEVDEPGPLPFVVAVERTGPEARVAPTRAVVFGDVDFATNQFWGVGSNSDLFMNACNWLLGHEDRVTLRPKKREGDRLPVTEAQLYGIMFFSVNLLPLLIVGMGFSVWAVRRRQ